MAPTISFGHTPHFSNYIFLYGLMAGKIRPQGVRIELKEMWSGQIDNLMVAGRLDAGAMSISTYMIGRAKGFPYVAIASAVAQTEQGTNSIWFPARAPVRTPRDLEGKRVGVAVATENVPHKGILKHRYGVDVDKITWIPKELPLLVALMDKGELDAAILWGDFYYKSLNDPRFRLLFQIGPEIKRMSGVYPVVQLTVIQERVVRERPQAVKALLGALRASRDYAKTANVEDFIDLYLRRRGEGDRDLLRRSTTGATMDFTFTPEEKRYIETYAGWAKEFGLVDRKLSLKELVFELD
ncbi:MAG: ABC transporter substrate-binding protein [Deltaproteobacteria bacterium]|nr:ABC transporter substrate-binding protein [Deltaproteobacteria bacterium]